MSIRTFLSPSSILDSTTIFRSAVVLVMLLLVATPLLVTTAAPVLAAGNCNFVIGESYTQEGDFLVFTGHAQVTCAGFPEGSTIIIADETAGVILNKCEPATACSTKFAPHTGANQVDVTVVSTPPFGSLSMTRYYTPSPPLPVTPTTTTTVPPVTTTTTTPPVTTVTTTTAAPTTPSVTTPPPTVSPSQKDSTTPTTDATSWVYELTDSGEQACSPLVLTDYPHLVDPCRYATLYTGDGTTVQLFFYGASHEESGLLLDNGLIAL